MAQCTQPPAGRPGNFVHQRNSPALWLLVLALSLGHCQRGPTPKETTEDAASKEETTLNAPETLAPGELSARFAGVPAQPINSADAAREVDAPFYSPAREGLRSLSASFRCEAVEEFLRGWMRNWSFSRDKIAAATLTVRYHWTPAEGNQVELLGWPDDFQPLEKKRHTHILRGMSELIVPPPHASYFPQYSLTVRRSEAGLLISARASDSSARMSQFRKLFAADWSKTYLQGVGKVSPFENLTDYRLVGTRRVVKEQAFYVDTSNVILRYTVEPEYQEVEGLLLPIRIRQVYRDETGEPKGLPVELELEGNYQVTREVER